MLGNDVGDLQWDLFQQRRLDRAHNRPFLRN